MSILDTIRRQFEPKIITDPTFGSLRFGRGWWVGCLLFSPTGADVQVMAEADEQGPTQTQRDLFAQIEQRYLGLQDAICDDLYELMLNRKGDYRREQVWREFTLDGVSLYRPDDAGPDFELSYEWSPDEEFTFGVFIKGWWPDGIVVYH